MLNPCSLLDGNQVQSGAYTFIFFIYINFCLLLCPGDGRRTGSLYPSLVELAPLIACFAIAVQLLCHERGLLVTRQAAADLLVGAILQINFVTSAGSNDGL
jgi:hypothetical protein